jgi:glycosyltransferase involved in cell wall biosynthesis
MDFIEKNYPDMAKTAAIEILPGLLKSDISMTWTADLHTAYVVFMSKVFGKPSIVIVGGYEVCNMPEINYGLQTQKYRGAVVRWVLRNATKVIVPSHAYKTKVHELVGVTAEVIPNCSEIPDTQLEKKQPAVIMVAGQYGNADSFMALKGIITYDAIANNMPEVSFYLIGDVDNKIREKCNSIKFIGGKDHNEVLDLLNRTKVYCQLSYTESFGVALLEAIQIGCIPVVTDKDGMAEIVQDNGFKIQYGDVAAGVYAIQQALHDNADRSKIISSERAKYSKEQRRLNFKKVIDSLEK